GLFHDDSRFGSATLPAAPGPIAARRSTDLCRRIGGGRADRAARRRTRSSISKTFRTYRKQPHLAFWHRRHHRSDYLAQAHQPSRPVALKQTSGYTSRQKLHRGAMKSTKNMTRRKALGTIGAAGAAALVSEATLLAATPEDLPETGHEGDG